VDLYYPGSDATNTQIGMKWTIWLIVMAVGCVVSCCLLTLAAMVAGAVGVGLLANIVYQLILSAGLHDYAYVRWIVLAIAALTGAVIGWKLLRVALRVFTPILGGFLFIAAVDDWGKWMHWWAIRPFWPRPEPGGQFFSHPDQFPWGDPKHSWLLLVIWVILAVLGFLVQWCLARRQARAYNKRCGNGQWKSSARSRCASSGKSQTGWDAKCLKMIVVSEILSHHVNDGTEATHCT